MNGDVDTIAALIAYDYRVAAHCHGCGHSHWLDLDEIGRRVGYDWHCVGRRWPLVCSACGSRNTAIRLHGRHPSSKNVRR